MTCLSLIQNAANELGLSSISSVVGSTDRLTIQLLALANREGRYIRSVHEWPRLTKEHTFTLTNGTANYALPADFDRTLYQTHWNRSRTFQLYGPMSPQEWQWRKSGINSTSPYQRFRVKNFTDSVFFIDPTPGASDAGQTIVYEYQTTNWCKPRTWAASQTYLASTYTFYNGNYYFTSAGGVTGATPPTHVVGTVSDGGVSWLYFSDPYQSFTADTDLSHIDEDLITLGVIWRFARQKGFDWEVYKAEYDSWLQKEMTTESSAPVLTLGRTDKGPIFIGPWSLPETGYGS